MRFLRNLYPHREKAIDKTKILLYDSPKQRLKGADDTDAENKVKNFCIAWQTLGMIYEDYARKSGVSYNSLYILSAISQSESCTQKQICERTLLPKQTVNNIVTAFYRSGYIGFCELPENRRVKIIHLTDKGRAYADELLPRIHASNLKAMETLTEEQQNTLIHLTNQYVAAFRREMLGD